MATYVNDLRLKEIATGDESGTWGTSTNTNLELIAEAFSFGTEAITTNADTHTTIIADGSTDPGRSLYLKYTGTLDSACTITIGPNTISKLWFIENGTSGSQNIIISQGSGANITIPPGDTKAIYSDGAGSGAAMVDVFASLNVVDLKVQDDLTVTDDATIGGTLGVTGIVTLTDDLIIGDGKTIGSASDVDAITIAANGQVTFTQTLIGTALDISGDIDVDGTTNLDVVDIDGAVDMASTLGVTGVVTANAGVVVDNFTLDGTTLALSSGDMTLDVAGDIILDAGNDTISLKDSGTQFGEFISSSTDFVIKSSVSDKDIIFKGNDGGSAITALSLDMSAAGAATFNAGVTIGTNTRLASASGILFLNGPSATAFEVGAGSEKMRLTSSSFVINDSSEDFDFRVESNGNTHMLFVDGGNDRVSIATTTPEEALHVTGTLRIDGNNNGITNGEAVNQIIFKDLDTTAGGGQTMGQIDWSTLDSDAPGVSARIAGTADSSTTGQGRIDFFTGAEGTLVNNLTMAAGEVCVNQASNDMDFRVESNGNTHMLFVDGGNDRVGIGTTSPAVALDVAGLTSVNSGNNSGVALKIGGEGGNGLKTQYIVTGSSHTNFQVGVATHASSTYSITPSTSAGGTTFTNAALNIDSSGNVGIGTTSPSTNNAQLVSFKDGGSFAYLGHNNSGGTFPKVSALSFGSSAVAFTHTTNGGTNALTGSAHIAAIQSASSGAPTDMAFYTTSGGVVAEKMRIDDSGHVLVGKTSGTSGNKIETDGRISAGAGSTGQPTFNCEGDTNTGINLPESDRIQFITGGTEAMRIDSSGNLLVNRTSQIGDNKVSINYVSGSSEKGMALNTADSGNATHINFMTGASVKGSISTDGSNVAYNTSSDARLKDVTGEARGLEVINELNPVAYNWKADGKADEGLIAQEVLDIVPNAVSGSEEDMYQMDYSKLVVHLVKGMKEQQELITTLQAEVALLKEK